MEGENEKELRQMRKKWMQKIEDLRKEIREMRERGRKGKEEEKEMEKGNGN